MPAIPEFQRIPEAQAAGSEFHCLSQLYWSLRPAWAIENVLKREGWRNEKRVLRTFPMWARLYQI